MRTGLAISSVVHASALMWALLTFTANPFESPPTDSLPVDIISPTEFSQLTAGSKTAKKQDAPKPLAEKLGEQKQVEDHTAKITEKKELQATKNEQTPPKPVEKTEAKPEPKPEPPKPAEKAEAKPEPKPEDKVDPIAEALKKDDSKKREEATKQAQKTPPEKKKPPKKQPEFNPQRIAALLDKREPTRQAATGDTINRAASLGIPAGSAATLSMSELDALRARLRQNWSVPPLAEKVIIRMVIKLTPDGRLSSPPQVITRGSGPAFEAFRDSAVRAVMVSQPFTMLRKETYDVWREIDIDFDERTMFGL